MDPIPAKTIHEIEGFLSFQRGKDRTAYQQCLIDKFFDEHFRPNGCVLPLVKVRERFSGQPEVIAIYQRVVAEHHALAAQATQDPPPAPRPRRKKKRRSRARPAPADADEGGSGRIPRTALGGAIATLADRATDEQLSQWSMARVGGVANALYWIKAATIAGLVVTAGWLGFHVWRGGRGAAETVGEEVRQVQEDVGNFAKGTSVDPVQTPLPKSDRKEIVHRKGEAPGR